MPLLSSVLKSRIQPLFLLQSSLAQTGLPVLSHIVNHSPAQKCLLFCLSFPPPALLPDEHVEVYDWIDRIPGYSEENIEDELVGIVKNALESTPDPVKIVIDSIDTLLADQKQPQSAYKCLWTLIRLVRSHGKSSLILHCQSPCDLVPLITQTSFSPSLIQITAYPSALLTHLATEFLIPPPPISPAPKFWSVFLPFSQRTLDVERTVFGSAGQGSGDASEFVIELIIRDALSRKREVERGIEGWSAQGSCELGNLQDLKPLWNKRTATQEKNMDPTENLSFNLGLTSSQLESRAQVPLPYAHEGQPSQTTGAIFYDPDSADDIDDEDPDEDLDI